MTWRPLSQRAGSDTRVKFDSDGRIIIKTQQECAPILDQNHAFRNDGTKGDTLGGQFRRVASIPNTIIAEWLKEGIDVWSGECQDAVARKLNDPDNFYLRTSKGRLGHVGNGNYI